MHKMVLGLSMSRTDVHMRQMITEGVRVLWKESVHRLQGTFLFLLNCLMNSVVKVPLKWIIHLFLFVGTQFPNFYTQSSLQLVYSVRISSKASATADVLKTCENW